MQRDTGARTALAPAPAPVLGSDPHDFAGLYIRHRASFTSHARRYLRDPRDADEVVQEAFLRLFLAMPELETELQALAYCRRTITNLCIDRYRADARRPRLVALEGAPIEELAEDDTGDPVVRAEDAALVRQALSQLPALHRAALVKREIEEKPLPVIADELDVAEDSVKHLLFRARRHLRKLLAGTSVAPGVDAELTRGLRPAVRGASGGVAGLLLLALLGLGSGPDLRAVPVVGVDLPDVLGVTAVADAVGGAVRDVVSVIVPGAQPEAHAAARELPSRPVIRSEAQPAAEGPTTGAARDQASQPAGTAGPAASATRRFPGAGAPTDRSPGLTTTVVTVVGGVPVVRVVPVTAVQPYDDVTGGRATVPGTSTGRGPGPFLPTPAGPRLPTTGLDVPGGSAAPPGLPSLEAAPRSGGSDVTPRSSRADDVTPNAADTAADRAADTAAKVDRATEKRAEQAADVVEKAQEKAQQAAEKAEKAALKVAEKAADAVARAAAAADRAEEKSAAQRAAAERTAAEAAAARAAEAAAAEAAAARAAEVAAARAAAAAATAAAAAAAEQATVAVTPVSTVATAVASAPAP